MDNIARSMSCIQKRRYLLVQKIEKNSLSQQRFLRIGVNENFHTKNDLDIISLHRRLCFYILTTQTFLSHLENLNPKLEIKKYGGYSNQLAPPNTFVFETKLARMNQNIY